MCSATERTDVHATTNTKETPMATKNPMTKIHMKTMTDETKARDLMVLLNRSRRGRAELVVMVDGPNDGEFTVMGLRDAIENEFAYRWEV